MGKHRSLKHCRYCRKEKCDTTSYEILRNLGPLESTCEDFPRYCNILQPQSAADVLCRGSALLLNNPALSAALIFQDPMDTELHPSKLRHTQAVITRAFPSLSKHDPKDLSIWGPHLANSFFSSTPCCSCASRLLEAEPSSSRRTSSEVFPRISRFCKRRRQTLGNPIYAPLSLSIST